MSGTRPRTARTPRTAIALALGALLAALLPLSQATAAKPVADDTIASSIAFTEVTDAAISLPDSPGANGLWYVVQDRTFTVDLAFVNAAGAPRPLSTSKAVTVSVKHGSTVLGSVEVPANETTAPLGGAGFVIADAAAGVRLTAVADTKPRATNGTSRPFDVLIKTLPVTAGGLTSIGDEGDGTHPCVPAPGTVCGDLLAPAGAEFGENGHLSQGECATGTKCVDTYVQAIVTFSPSPTNPATLVMKCDKDACGVGAIKNKKLQVTLSPESPEPNDPRAVDYEAPACSAKGVVDYVPGTVGPGNLPFCVDYVQSTRDNAGNTLLHLLFVEDAKVRFS